MSYPIFTRENNKKELYDALIYFIFRPLLNIQSKIESKIESIQCNHIDATTSNSKKKVNLLQIPDFFIGLIIRCLIYCIIALMIPVTLINFFTYYLHSICRNTMLMLYGISSDLKAHKMIEMNLFHKVKYVTHNILKLIYSPFKKNTTKTNTSIQNILLFIIILMNIILFEVLDKISLCNTINIISLFIFLISFINQYIIIHSIELIIAPIVNIPLIVLISMMFITEYISMTNIYDLEKPILDKCLCPFLRLDITNISDGCFDNYRSMIILVVVRSIVLLLRFCYCVIFGIVNIIWRVVFGKPLHRLSL